MTSIPDNHGDLLILRRMRRINFTVYRRGAVAFHLESRRQGHIRKVTQATYKEEIMTDDSINITLLATERMDFKLRDYIVYYDRPYFLNRLPEVSIDTSKRYVYKLTFEGAMFELGRVAFVLQNAIGYDYYGTLPEFARLIVDNMNRVNMWVEWRYNNHSYKARFKRTVEITHGGTTKLVYMWGTGFNGDLEGMGERFIYTDGIPSVNGHALDPEDFSTVSSVTITAIRKWSLSFPVLTTTPTQYPQPAVHIPDDEYTYAWCSAQDAIYEAYMDAINACVAAGSWYDTNGLGSYEWGVDCELVSGSITEETLPSPTVNFPTSPTDTNTVQQQIRFQLHYEQWHEDLQYGGGEVIDGEWWEWVTIYRNVTYTPVVNSQTSWQVTPITPQSGTATSIDYPTESILLAYDQHSCLAVLQDLTSQWEDWEWRMSDSVQYGFVNGEILVCGTIVMKRREANASFTTVHRMGFGRSGGLSSIKLKYDDDGNIPSRVYFYGGTQNLPQYYRNTRLCLPGYSKEASFIDFGEINPSPFLLALDNKTCEEIKVFDDIYPACKPFTIGQGWLVEIVDETFTTSYGTSTKKYLQLVIPIDEFFVIPAKWKSFDEMQSPYPDYLEWLTLKQYTDTADNRKRYVQYYVGRHKYQNGKGTPMVVFQSGELAGYQLSVHDCYIDEKMYEGKYIILQLNVVKEDNEEFRDVSGNAPEAYFVPNDDICCRQGDKFIIENINMPVAYTYYGDGSANDYSAENALWKAAMDYMNEKVQNICYELDVARDYVTKHNTLFRCFDGIQFSDLLTDDTVLRKRINSVELDLVDGYKYKIGISNGSIKNPLHVLGQIIGHHYNGL